MLAGINKLKRVFRIFVLFSRFSMKAVFQAKVGIFFFTFGKILRFLLFFLFVYFLISRTKALQGFNVNQIIFFYLTFNIVDTTSQLLFREVYRFRSLVLNGTLDTILVKPYHPFLRILIGGVDFLDLLTLPLYLLLTLYFAIQLGSLQLLNIILYFALILNALIIATAFHIFVLALGILTTQVDHAIMIYRDLTSLGRFPMEIYREPIRSLFTFVIPVGIMMSFPSKALFGLLSTNVVIFSFLVSLILLFFSLKLWDISLKKYQAYGG